LHVRHGADLNVANRNERSLGNVHSYLLLVFSTGSVCRRGRLANNRDIWPLIVDRTNKVILFIYFHRYVWHRNIALADPWSKLTGDLNGEDIVETMPDRTFKVWIHSR